MTLEESLEVIPLLEDMIVQIEGQQELMADMYQELQEKENLIIHCQKQNQKLQRLNAELQTQLEILPDIEELLNLLDAQNGQIRGLEIENQQWRELTEKLNSENTQLQTQNRQLLDIGKA